MTLSALGDPKYIALETFRKNGQGVVTPVWTVARDGKLLVWTQRDSWKVKRIRNNAHVRVAPCDVRGTPQGPWVDASATVLESPEQERAMQGYLKKKYPFMFRLFQLLYAFRRQNSARVVLEIQDS